jgi:hypothetical protein
LWLEYNKSPLLHLYTNVELPIQPLGDVIKKKRGNRILCHAIACCVYVPHTFENCEGGSGRRFFGRGIRVKRGGNTELVRDVNESERV